MRKLLGINLLVVSLLVGGLPMTNVFQQLSVLSVHGVNIVNAAGARFVAKGINVEMYRDYANGCGWVTDGQYAIKNVIADKIQALGTNIVRLNYSYRFLQQSGNLTRFLDMAQELALRGMYIMPSDHTYTGGVLTGASASYPMMKNIVDGMKARGLENHLVMNPWNEPGPNITIEQWKQAQKDVLTYLRKTVKFTGVVVLDGSGWSTLLDVGAFKDVMAHDASLAGSPNVVFSNHLYPNIKDLPARIWIASKQVPLIIGELGQENPGASPLDPNYVKSVIQQFFEVGMDAGHNGLFAWIFAWCDSNSMLDDTWTDENGDANNEPYSERSPLTEFGNLWKVFFFNRFGAATPVPTVATVQVSATKSPTKQATAKASTTPQPTLKPSSTPPKTATTAPTQPSVWVCEAILEEEVLYNGRKLRAVTCLMNP